MIFDHQFLTFAIAASILTITPGNDTFLVFNRTLGNGRRCGVAAALGILSGLPVHGFLASVGLSVILVQSAKLFMIVKYVGAAYLAYLGFRGIRDAWRRKAGSNHAGAVASLVKQRSLRRCFVEGFLGNLLNPKVAVFYLSFLPQFINPGDPVMLKSIAMAGFHWLTGVVWLFFVVFAVAKARVILKQPNVRRWLETVSGTVLVAFGVKLALSRR
jgi:RhtB (resistance to homoserine/threonine) family protein